MRAGNAEAFERIYGAEGDWARLFRKAEGYLGTELRRDGKRASRYLTVDRWRSRADLERFRAQHDEEYRALDARCEQLTTAEELVGEFEEEES